MNLSKQPASQSRAKHKSSILILTLWSLCLLSVFAVYLGYGVRQKIILVQRLEERNKSRLIAEAGIKKAIAELKNQEETSYDSLNDNRGNNAGLFKKVGVGDGTFSVCYNYLNDEGFLETRYGFIDEERKININTADQPVLERFFRICLDLDELTAQELAASIIDWRDSDSELSIPLGSAEDRDYRNSRYPYEAKDDKFEILEEVLLVNGVTEEIFNNIKDCITIYGDGKININTASRNIFLSLGIESNVTDNILAYRGGEDGIAGTTDDNFFETTSNIVPKLSQFCHLNDSEISRFSNLVENSLVTKSNNFAIRSVANLNQREHKKEIVCVVNRAGRILRWQEL